MKLSKTTLLAALGVLTPVAIAGGPGTVTTLYTSIATSPTSDVPGLPGTKFTPTTTATTFDRPWVSPNGLHWGIRADTPLAATLDRVFVYDNVVLQQEGTTTPFSAPDTWGETDIRVGINDAGEVCLFSNTSAAANDDYIVKYSPVGPTWTIIAQEAGAIPALAGTTYDDDLDSISLLADGRVAFRADLIDGAVATNQNEILVLDTTLVAQNGVTIPAGQLAAPLAWDNFTVENYWVSPDGLNILIDGDLTGTTTDDVTVFNGNVVIQEGFPIPGTTFVSNVATGGPAEIGLDVAGRWFARGSNVDSQDWVVRNGVVLAKTDDPTGAPERPTMDGAANGTQVVPPSGSTATAVADFLVDTAQNLLWYDVALTGITGETAANIASGGPGSNGPVLYTLPLGTPKRGSITYLEADEANILAGLTYLEILTTGLPAGAIRGQIVAETETWDDTDFTACFFGMSGNTSGDYVFGGVTSAPFSVNGVVCLNGAQILMRENDPVDVDGNGLFDDDAYWNTFGDDDFVLLADGTLYFTATMRNAAGTIIGQGVFRREGGNGNSFAFCFGDGTLTDHTTPCPCGNNGAPGNGCGHSFDPNGANMSATGTPALDDVVLHSQFEPASSFTLMMQHASTGDSVFHDGVLCAGNPLIRLRGRAAVGGEAFFPNSNFAQDSTTTLSIRGGTFPGSGATMRYAAWYRNASTTFCPPATANVTNGWTIVW